MENSGNPWGMSQGERADWAKPLDGINILDGGDPFESEYLYWVGCAGSFDDKNKKVTQAVAKLLQRANVSFSILGPAENCTGDPARRSGNEYIFQMLAMQNIETLDGMGVKKIITQCPHCFNTLMNEYPQLGGHYEVVHHTQLIERLTAEGRLPPLAETRKVTFHDPCYLGRHNGEYDAPRAVLAGGGTNLIEMEKSRNDSFCCGAGGAQFWKEEEPGDMRVSENRYQEAVATGAEVIATGCPFCKVMLASSDSAEQEGAPEVLDVAQLVAMKLDGIQALIDHHQATSTGACAALD